MMKSAAVRSPLFAMLAGCMGAGKPGATHGLGWTLEMGRKFDTGRRDDDASIDPKADNRCAIAVLDDELYEEHSASTLIHLRLVGGPGR